MSLRTLCHQGSHKPSSCATFKLKSPRGRAAQAKKILHLCIQGHFGHVQLFTTLWPARLLFKKGGSSGKNTGVYWPILVAIPF